MTKDARDAPASRVSGQLALRLTWLTALRLFVLTAALVVTTLFYLGGFDAGGFSSQLALATVGAAYLLTVVYAVVLRRGRGLAAASYAQLVTDQLAWTVIVYISGGAQSGATSLYGLTTLSGAILLGLRGGVVAAVSGATFFAALCAALVTGVLGAPRDQSADAYASRWSEVAYPLLINGVGIVVVTALSGYLAERLRTTGGRLAVATARAEQAERLAMLGRVATALAHEIRNPLGSIAGSIELLRAGPALTDEDRELCDIVVREAARLDDLVTDMLDLTRTRPLTLVRVDVAALARDVVVLAGKSGRGRDVRTRYEGPDELVVTADAAQLRQIAWNLLRNAIQASPAGAEVLVTLRERDERPSLAPRSQRDLTSSPPPRPSLAAHVELAVSDDGPGIADSQRDKLFDAFFTTRAHGVGIGLAVVKRICDAHGFFVEVDSEVGKGAVFRVLMPRAPAA